MLGKIRGNKIYVALTILVAFVKYVAVAYTNKIMFRYDVAISISRIRIYSFMEMVLKHYENNFTRVEWTLKNR
jgi:hypothetical protein